ncbi:MAG TPA: T9SS type A sorting domain-containing protein [Cytophagaceae bacterium]|nr:T9SS type A sorting domain-containing protein [Cytophagaceae bacterium]
MTDTSTITINGKTLRQLKTTTDNPLLGFGDTTIIETLGGIFYMFPQDYGLSDNNIILGLRCYQDNVFGPYQANPNTGCELLVTDSKNATTEPDVHFFPNPTSGTVTLVSPFTEQEQELYVYTLEGQLVNRQYIDPNITSTILELPQKGTYVVVLKIGEQKTVTRKITKL